MVEIEERGLRPIMRRIAYIFLIVAILIATLALIGEIREKRNFENEVLNGQYGGTLYPEQNPPFVINVTFDGQGSANGTVKVNGRVESFETDYIVVSREFKMNFNYNNTVSFQLIGAVIGDGEEVLGDLQMWDSADIYNGTYSMFKYAD